jgi:hypothetical protein
VRADPPPERRLWAGCALRPLREAPRCDAFPAAMVWFVLWEGLRSVMLVADAVRCVHGNHSTSAPSVDLDKRLMRYAVADVRV